MNKFIYLGSEWAESHEKLYLLGDSILFLLFLLGVLYLFIFAFFSLKNEKTHTRKPGRDIVSPCCFRLTTKTR